MISINYYYCIIKFSRLQKYSITYIYLFPLKLKCASELIFTCYYNYYYYFRSCIGVKKTEDMYMDYPCQTHVHSVFFETKKAEYKVNRLTDKQEQNLTAIKMQRETIQAKLNDTEARLIEHIKVLKGKALACLNNKYSTLKSSLVSSINRLSSTTEELRQAQEQLKSIHNLEREQQFVKVTLIRKIARDANTVITGDTYHSRSIEFKENTELMNCVIVSDCLGDITSKTENGEKCVQYSPWSYYYSDTLYR